MVEIVLSELFFQILVFPGFAFVLILTFLLEQIASNVSNKFYSGEIRAPMFIPIVEQLKLITKGEREKFSFKTILQGFILLLMIVLPLFAFLMFPISLYGELPSTIIVKGVPKDEGVIGRISFEGDILLLFAIIILFNVLVFLVQILEENKSVKDAISVTVKFMLFDIPLFIALGSPILVEKSLSLGIIAEDIRWVVSDNLAFGLLLLIPLSSFVAIFALILKFDQPYFDRRNPEDIVSIQSPVRKNWKLALWNLSVSLMEFLVIGLIVMICLGGSHVPIPTSENNSFIGYSLNFIFKCVIVIIITSIVKAIRPRLKLTQAINYSFKFLTPIGLGSLLIVGILLGVQVLNL
ncbi:MAG: NADH-quinone oxidoreductase subunit H [Asgard group archaeon]|nr:NADH-quinone oxidoreductase subunit H [Asgard group archaeon]